MSGNPLILSWLLARYLRDEISPHFITENIASLIGVFVDEWDSVRGVRRSTSPNNSPYRKMAMLRHIAGHLILRKQERFSLDEFRGLIELINVEQEPARILATFEEETGLIIRIDDQNWRFAHRAIQDCLAASYFVDKSAALSDAKYETEGWWPRLLRYMSSLASDPSRLIKPFLEKGFDERIAILMSEVLTQNLLIERSTVSGFGIYVTNTLKNLVGHAVVESYSKPDGAASKWQLVLQLENTEVATAQAACNLITMIYKTRDGVAKQETPARLAATGSAALTNLASLFEAEGELGCHLFQEGKGCRIMIVLLSPNEQKATN